MSEWKELKIDNLPADIFITEKYEFRQKGDSFCYTADNDETKIGIFEILLGKREHRGLEYRKLEPKAPNHEEIMSLWWKWDTDDGPCWHKAVAYIPDEMSPYKISAYSGYVGYTQSAFIGRESATIPPEANS